MSLSISHDYKSPNFNQREDMKLLDTIIIHYTGMKNYQSALEYLCNLNSKVSAHYFINEEGKIWQIVDDEMTAWHAGVSKWLDRKNLNSSSIGIELVNPGHEYGYKNFSLSQYQSLEQLIEILIKKYNIKQDRILGHSDIAPLRKSDPGEKFDWKRLSKKGLSIWPKEILNIPQNINSKNFLYNLLFEIGYDVENDFKSSLVAFKRHFIQSELTTDINETVIKVAYSVSMAFNKVRSLY